MLVVLRVNVSVGVSLSASAANRWTLLSLSNKYHYHWHSFGTGQMETSDFAPESMSGRNERRSCKMNCKYTTGGLK